jgi:prevent-host-death family protein
VSTVSIRELQRNASRVVDDVAASGRPALVTRHGHPVAALVPVAERELEDLVLAAAARSAIADPEAAARLVRD